MTLHRKKRGFTLVELLLVITIVVLLAGVGLSSMIRTQATFVFNGTVQQVESIMRDARSFAISGKALPDYTDYDEDDDTAELLAPAHYGLFFDIDAQRMVLFADLHEGEDYYGTPGIYNGSAGMGLYDDDSDVVLAFYDLPSTITLQVDPAADTVLYTPLFADVFFAEGEDGDPVNKYSDFFLFGIEEADGDRFRCYGVNPVAGIVETSEAAEVPCL